MNLKRRTWIGSVVLPLAAAACVVLQPLCVLDARAASDEVLQELQALKQRIRELERRLGEQDERITEQEQQITEQRTSIEEVAKIREAIGNLEFGIGATTVVQGTVNNDRNHRRVPGIEEKGDDADASYSVDIEIGARIGEHGRAFMLLEAGEGEGLNEEVAGLTGVNADALGESRELEVAELYYEHRFLRDQVVLTVGKLDPTVYFDTNNAANDETTQFLADIFVNNIAVDWPDYSYGARLSWYPADWLELNTGYLEADGDFEDIFDDNFYIAEAVFKPVFGDLAGFYRLYAWRNSGEHEKLRDERRTSKTGEGFGISFDQQVHPDVTAFARWGIQDHDLYAVRQSWSLGLQVAGSLWGRAEDAFGLAFGRADTTDDYRDLLREEGFGTTPGESRVEAYYRFQVHDHLAISPDFQWVDGLAGSSRADRVSIFGVRAQLHF